MWAILVKLCIPFTFRVEVETLRIFLQNVGVPAVADQIPHDQLLAERCEKFRRVGEFSGDV